MTKITVVRDDDGWEAVYFDGIVVAQNHTVDYTYSILPKLIGQNLESVDVFFTNTLTEKYGGWAPDMLEDFEDGDLTPD